MKNQPFSRRLRFALAGLVEALRTENSFRVQAVAAFAALVALLWWRPTPIWWAIVMMTAGFVLAAELLNTAIEHLADHLHPDEHARIRVVKDCAAAAVLVASISALAVAGAAILELLG